MRAIVSACLLLVLSATPALAAAAAEDAPAQIRGVIARMEEAWNRGDFRGYMEGFENPGVKFVSRGRMQADWQATLDHYVRDYGGDPDKRGHLHFSDIQVEMLAPDAAQLISHYHLEKPVDAQDGINTRLMRKVGGRWVIALNHVSSKEPVADPVADTAAIKAVLAAQVEAWNRGDLDGYMAGYWNSPKLKFVSGASVTTGWAETLARYKARYDTAEKRGRLAFTSLDVQLLGPDAAVAMGGWRIERAEPAQGMFTLTLRRLSGQWVIVLDHTS
jgi:ketosteroid isomerase-like protein